MVQNVGKKGPLVLLLSIILLTIVLLLNLNMQYIHAEADTLNMRSVFERIKTQIDNNQDFFVTIQFVTPLVEGEKVWQIPDTREAADDEVSVYISEVGDDYICFDSLRGSARYLECTPYSNIAGVWHLIE